MKNLSRIINIVNNGKWLITPSHLQSIKKQLISHLDGELPIDLEDEAEIESFKAPIMPSNIGLIIVDGVIGKHLSKLETQCGGVDLDEINCQLTDIENKPEIDTVLFYFNSPGGVSTGVKETAEKIKQLSLTKTCIAYTDTMCASAAYWLASQCNYFYCSESSDIGSINAYCLVLDESEALRNEGIKVNEFVGSNGKYKTSGASYKPLSDDEKKMFQDDINRLEKQFIDSVMNSRKEIKYEDCNGMVFDGETATQKNLTDGIIPTIEDFFQYVMGNKTK